MASITLITLITPITLTGEVVVAAVVVAVTQGLDRRDMYVNRLIRLIGVSSSSSHSTGTGSEKHLSSSSGSSISIGSICVHANQYFN